MQQPDQTILDTETDIDPGSLLAIPSPPVIGPTMYSKRIKLYEELEGMLGGKLLVYVTSDRPGFAAYIDGDVIDPFIDQLDKMRIQKKLSLYLYTRGGHVSVAWNIVNLLRLYCDELQVIIPHNARSGGTLISIGADSIIMTKQATLGPIDPSVNTPLNPQIPNTPQQFLPVSVEAVKGYLAFAKEELAIKDDIAMASILTKLSENVHPLVLGEVYRSQSQIKMLAERLLSGKIKDAGKIQEIISFLCSDSGSHDYTINRREAKQKLGLNVVVPTDEEYDCIKAIYDNVSGELGFRQPFDPHAVGTYSVKRVILESASGGSHYFETSWECNRIQVTNPMIPGLTQDAYQNQITFEGWKYEQ